MENSHLKSIIKQKLAFTLAEVLVTLAIIGIIAAMTIPIIITKYEKQQTVTGLQKADSVLSSAFARSVNDNGPSTFWLDPTVTLDIPNSATWWNTYLIPYLNVQKSCNTVISGTNSTNCWAESTWLDNQSLAVSDGWITLILNDGMTMLLRLVSTGYGQLFVDINGLKKPNVVGKDIFRFDYNFSLEKVKLNGQGNNRTSLLQAADNSCNKIHGNQMGVSCGAIIQMDGWKISDDYPW